MISMTGHEAQLFLLWEFENMYSNETNLQYRFASNAHTVKGIELNIYVLYKMKLLFVWICKIHQRVYVAVRT